MVVSQALAGPALQNSKSRSRKDFLLEFRQEFDQEVTPERTKKLNQLAHALRDESLQLKLSSTGRSHVATLKGVIAEGEAKAYCFKFAILGDGEPVVPASDIIRLSFLSG